MIHPTKTTAPGWLAFDLNILRRLEFNSIALPFTADPALGLYLKRREVRVMANDLLQSSWTKAVAMIQNNSEKLTDTDVNVILEDSYVPRHRLLNPALRHWFNETDSWWFDNVRQNLDKLESPFAFALGATLAMGVGDYVHSFTEETLELRQPLSNVFRRLWTLLPDPVNNGQNNSCQNKTANEFIAESPADLLFLRLPPIGSRHDHADRTLWREEWLRGGNDFWSDVEAARSGRLGMAVETKSQYLQLLEETLRTASHIKTWAIAHVESGYLSAQDLVEVIGRIRRVDAIFTKDFSELTGTKAVIITA
jgi:hypothetical protein